MAELELAARCQTAGIPLSTDAAAALVQFHALLMDWNQRMDLTAVLEESEMADRHYVDSLIALKEPGLFPQGISVIDVGSGAGFPGLPLAVARPDLQVTLLDAQQKRVRFLEAAVALLKLPNVKVVHLRAEDAAHSPALREQFGAALARAVAPLPVLMELLLPFVRPGGLALCWKGPGVSAELIPAGRAAALLGGQLMPLLPVTIPGRDWSHVLVPCKKTGKTLRQYPRKAGTPGREPLGGSE